MSLYQYAIQSSVQDIQLSWWIKVFNWMHLLIGRVSKPFQISLIFFMYIFSKTRFDAEFKRGNNCIVCENANFIDTTNMDLLMHTVKI